MAGFASSLTLFTPAQTEPATSFILTGIFVPTAAPPINPGAFAQSLKLFTPAQALVAASFILAGTFVPVLPPPPPPTPPAFQIPPTLNPTSLTQILPAYVYKQFNDDPNVAAFFQAYNTTAQNYMDWFTNINLPIYTGLLSPLLDWVAQGLYGLTRPSLPYGVATGVGYPNTYMGNAFMPNQFLTTGTVTDFTVNDDYFKRIITWHFFKGDGFVFDISWLKRRVMRFLIGTNGTSPNIDSTYPISVQFTTGNNVLITIFNLAVFTNITPGAAQIFQAAVASGAVMLPFQFSFSVSISV